MNFHGGDIYNYNKQLLDFSSNINPVGMPESFKRELINNMEDFTRYPDIEYRALRANLGKYLGNIDKEMIIVGNGAVELIYKGISALECSYSAALSPTFVEYRAASALNNMDFTNMGEYDETEEAFNVKKILTYIKKNMVMILCNPNNPTGSFIKLPEMQLIADELERQGSYLIVDESFIEFTDDYPHNSMINFIDKYDNLIVIRATTKFFGMPGIRLGYAICHNTKINASIKSKLEPWNINTAAVIAGETVFFDDDYIKATREWIKAERQYVYDRLINIKHIKTYKSYANYHLIELLNLDMDAWQLKEKMAERGILIRTPEGFHHLTKYHVRLAVKDRPSNKIMCDLLEEILEGQR